jgi:pteridine reductase
MNELSGKVALVTGAGTRVGAEIARALGAERMRVAVHHHGSSQGADATCRAIEAAGGEAWPVRADLYDEAQARGLIDATLERFGQLDLLVPSAANYDRVPLAEIERSHFAHAFELNLLAPFTLVQRALPALQAARGAVVLITDISRAVPLRDYLPYEVSKAGLHQMMRVLALNLAPHVRVNAVAPGTVLPPPDLSEAQVAEITAQIPLGRTGGAGSVADAVVYLAKASFVTGTEITVDGGRALSL